MSLVKYNGNLPNLLDGFFGRDMDEMFNFNWPDWSNWMRVGTSIPAVNIQEDNDYFHLEIAAPGLKKEDFKVTLEDDMLTISVQHIEENKEKSDKGRYTKREYSYQGFTRSFRLPDSCQNENINAQYIDGILHLTVPKKEEAKQKDLRQIEIT
jgi:HSP20 family protein